MNPINSPQIQSSAISTPAATTASTPTMGFEKITDSDPVSKQTATAQKEAPPPKIEDPPDEDGPFSFASSTTMIDEEAVNVQPTVDATAIDFNLLATGAAPPKDVSEVLDLMVDQGKLFEQSDAKLTLLDKIGWMNPAEHAKHEAMIKDGTIYQEINNRQSLIDSAKQTLTPAITKRHKRPFNDQTKLLHQNLSTSTSKISRSSGGQGGAYVGQKVMVKPKGESISELHNAKGNSYVTSNNNTRVRNAIPTYQENEREVASYELAYNCGLGDITPPTIMAIVTNDNFSDLSDRLVDEDKKKYDEHVIPATKEKVCTIQQFVPHANAKNIDDYREQWENELVDSKKAKGEKATEDDWDNLWESKCRSFDERDFERCHLQCWLVGENDGNKGNFMIYPKADNKFGMVKIDNGLALPEENQLLVNDLTKTPHGSNVLSKEAKELIRNINPDKACEPLIFYGLTATVDATRTRIAVMQRLIKEFPDITIREMNLRLNLLGKGEEASFKNLTNPEKMTLGDAKPAERKVMSRVEALRENFNSSANQTKVNSEKPQVQETVKERKARLEEAQKDAKSVKESNDSLISKGRVKAMIQQFNGEQKP